MPQFRFFLQLPKLIIDNNKNLKFLYVIKLLRDITNQMGLFFLPIYLFQVGQEIRWFASLGLDPIQKGMLAIAFFFLAERATLLITSMVSGRIISKVGFTKSILYSYFIRLGFFASLAFLNTYPQFFIIAAILEGLQGNFFWPSYYCLFERPQK